MIITLIVSIKTINTQLVLHNFTLVITVTIVIKQQSTNFIQFDTN